MNSLVASAFVALLATPLMAGAATVSITPTTSGHCIHSTTICFGNYNFGAYALDGAVNGIRHFMTFDLSGLSGTVTSARLEIDAGQHAYATYLTTKDYYVTGLSVDYSQVTSYIGGPAGLALHAAIGSSPLFGSTVVDTSLNDNRPHYMPEVTVDLGLGLHDLSVALGDFIALGGFTTGQGQLFYPWLAGNGPTGTRLVLDIESTPLTPVPTPATLPLAVIGLSAFAVARRRALQR